MASNQTDTSKQKRKSGTDPQPAEPGFRPVRPAGPESMKYDREDAVDRGQRSVRQILPGAIRRPAITSRDHRSPYPQLVEGRGDRSWVPAASWFDGLDHEAAVWRRSRYQLPCYVPPRHHGFGEVAQRSDRRVPVDATIGDRLPIDQRLTRHEVLPAERRGSIPPSRR